MTAYEDYLNNLMGDLNVQNGMMTRMPIMPDVSNISGAVQSQPSYYTPMQLSDLDAIRSAKQAEIAQRAGAAMIENPSEQNILAANVAGGDYFSPMGGNTLGQGVNQNMASLGLGMLAAAEKLSKISPLTAAMLQLAGGSIADYQIGANAAADARLAEIAAQGIPGVVSVSDKHGNVYSYSSPETIAAADRAMFDYSYSPSDTSSGGDSNAGSFSDYGGGFGSDFGASGSYW